MEGWDSEECAVAAGGRGTLKEEVVEGEAKRKGMLETEAVGGTAAHEVEVVERRDSLEGVETRGRGSVEAGGRGLLKRAETGGRGLLERAETGGRGSLGMGSLDLAVALQHSVHSGRARQVGLPQRAIAVAATNCERIQ